MLKQALALRVIAKLQGAVDRSRANLTGFDPQLDYAQQALNRLNQLVNLSDPVPELAEQALMLTPAYAEVLSEVAEEMAATLDQRIEAVQKRLHDFCCDPGHIQNQKYLGRNDDEGLF